MDIDLRSVDHVLTTTRSVRRRLDFGRPVPDDVIAQCLDIATQAPTGGNLQGWRWVVVTDADKRAAIADIYCRLLEDYMPVAARVFGEERTRQAYEDPGATHLAEHLADVPVLVVPCIIGRFEDMAEAFDAHEAPFQVTPNFAASGHYASIWCATWSFMLALRSRGLGSTLTTLHLLEEQTVAELLGIPSGVTQAGLVPVAYFTGADFGRGVRRPAPEVTYWNEWRSRRPPAGDA